VITRERLLNEIWGLQEFPTTRTVDTFMLRLRQKIERAPHRPAHFITVHGAGYKFVP
jgi:DNA-binding response OmpR family regulator